MVRVVPSADLKPISPANASPLRIVKTGFAVSFSIPAMTSCVCSTRCVAATNGSQRPRCSRWVSMAPKIAGASPLHSERSEKSSNSGIVFMVYAGFGCKGSEKSGKLFLYIK